MPDVRDDVLIDWNRSGLPHGGLDGGVPKNLPPLDGWLAKTLADILRHRKFWPIPWPLPWPQPEPDPIIWRARVAVLVGRAVAEKTIELAVNAEYGAAPKQAAGQFANAFVDFYCGTPPRRPWPWPHGIEVPLDRHNLLLLAGQLQAGAALGGGEAVAAAAQKIVRTAGG